MADIGSSRSCLCDGSAPPSPSSPRRKSCVIFEEETIAINKLHSRNYQYDQSISATKLFTLEEIDSIDIVNDTKMRITFPMNSMALLWLAASGIDGYLTNSRTTTTPAWTRSTSSLHVSIGLGPDEKEVDRRDMVAGVDYEVPDHEAYRLSRRSKLDEQCDEWYGKLLGEENGILGSLAADARKIATTPVPLKNEVGFISVLRFQVVLS